MRVPMISGKIMKSIASIAKPVVQAQNARRLVAGSDWDLDVGIVL